MVGVSLGVELNENMANSARLVAAARLWKVLAFAFDASLLKHEVKELRAR